MSALLALLRPRQWSKNLVVFAGLIFAQELRSSRLVWESIAAFALFCLASSAVYILNDIVDREQDACHPVKRLRPIASGAVAVPTAAVLALALGGSALGMGLWLGKSFALVLAGYVALIVAYSLLLRNVIILDVMAIAAGFVLRAVGGAVAIQVEISPWLIVCTTLLALFLGLSKRRGELVAVGEENAVAHRPLLAEYSPSLLDQMIGIVAAATIVSYALYTMWPATVEKFHGHNLALTIPFVLYGMFRYLYLVHRKGEGGSPENVLLTDKPLALNIVLWVIAVVAIIYGR